MSEVGVPFIVMTPPAFDDELNAVMPVILGFAIARTFASVPLVLMAFATAIALALGF